MRAFARALAFTVAVSGGNTAFGAQIEIGYTPSSDIAPIFSAIEEGLLAKRGLEVAMEAGNGAVVRADPSSTNV